MRSYYYVNPVIPRGPRGRTQIPPAVADRDITKPFALGHTPSLLYKATQFEDHGKTARLQNQAQKFEKSQRTVVLRSNLRPKMVF